MNKYELSYKELVEEAQKLNSENFVLTGKNADQINAMFCVLWIEIQKLKEIKND